MISETEMIIRLGIAALLGMLVGIERERQNQPAGLRTHTILAIGSCLAMTVSINLAFQYADEFGTGDPARLAAQVVSGIGFLGAGAILRYGTNVKGLTTATSLWTMAIVGLAVGAGHYYAGLITTFGMLVILVALNFIEKKLIRAYETITLAVTAENNPGIVEDLLELFKNMKKKVLNLGVDSDVTGNHQTVTLIIKTIEEDPMDDIRDGLKTVPGVKRFKLN